MCNTALSREFINSFFSELCLNQIPYCILHNVDEVASGNSHDIDMCIDERKLIDAEEILQTTASQHGWRMHLHTGTCKDTFNAKSYHFHQIDEQAQSITLIHFDFVPVTAWRGREIISNKTLLSGAESSGLYRSAAPEVMAVVDLFPHLLYRGIIKDDYKDRIHSAFSDIPEKIRPIILNFLSGKLTNEVISHAQHCRWDAISALRPQITQSALKRAPRRRWAHLCHILNKLMKPTGLMVVFQGTDGSGKTTIINGIPEILGNSFSGDTLDYYHWRPGFLKPEKKLDANGQPLTDLRPHTHAPDGRVRSLFKLGFHTLDYLAGYWFRVRKQISQGHLVVFDRYFYDFYIDKRRYCLNVSDTLVRLFQLFIPEPNLTFLLIGDATQLYERKGELPIREIQDQIDRLLQNKENIANPVVIDACSSIQTVRFNTYKVMLETLEQRHLNSIAPTKKHSLHIK